MDLIWNNITMVVVCVVLTAVYSVVEYVYNRLVNNNNEEVVMNDISCKSCTYRDTCTHMDRVDDICGMYSDDVTINKEDCMAAVGTWVLEHMLNREKITTMIKDSGTREWTWVVNAQRSNVAIDYGVYHDNKYLHTVNKPVVSKGYIRMVRMALATIAAIPVIYVCAIIISLA